MHASLAVPTYTCAAAPERGRPSQLTLCPLCGHGMRRQVHNPPTAELIVLSRHELDPCSNSSDGNSSGTSGLPLGLESVKSCYALTADSLQRLKGVSAQMGAGRRCSTKQQLLQWRPYLKQVSCWLGSCRWSGF